ncbi:MAG: DUF4870 domain-containing protein [Planctomycetota bacterium]
MSDTPENQEGQAPEQPTETSPSEPTPSIPDTTPPTDIPDDAKNMAMLAHLLGGIFSVLGALIIWLIKKDEFPFVDQEGKEAVNFQLTIFFGYVILIPVSVVTCGIGGVLYLPLFIVALVFGIIAALQAKEGKAYKYPFAIRLIK